jgi:hypothetical protein
VFFRLSTAKLSWTNPWLKTQEIAFPRFKFLNFLGGGVGSWKIQTVQEFFSAQANKTDIFSCKSAAQDIFSTIYFAAGYFFNCLS